MSRIGKLPIAIPDSISVSLNDNSVSFDNKKEKKSYTVRPGVLLSYKDSILKVTPRPGFDNIAIDVGMDRSNINNIVLGLTIPFKIVLEIIGVGYKFSISNKIVTLNLGFSHDIIYVLPDAVEAKSEGPNLLALSSSNKILVGQVASEIIAFRKPEPYKGKGVNIQGRYIVRKEGKKK